MKTLILATVGAVALMFAGTKSADAGCYGGYGGGYGGYGGGYGGSVNYGYAPQAYSGHLHHNVNPFVNPGYGAHLDYHNTTHMDYVPARAVPHYGHLDYQPGGYILHQTGHYDLHH